jgi:diacylglycerol kinase
MSANERKKGFEHLQAILSNVLCATRAALKNRIFMCMAIFCVIGLVIGWLTGIGTLKLVLLFAIACIGIGLEIANLTVETMMNIVHEANDPRVKVVKDAFSAMPIYTFTAYVVSWLVLVLPAIWKWILR